jgi:hypothetical protein
MSIFENSSELQIRIAWEDTERAGPSGFSKHFQLAEDLKLCDSSVQYQISESAS